MLKKISVTLTPGDLLGGARRRNAGETSSGPVGRGSAEPGGAQLDLCGRGARIGHHGDRVARGGGEARTHLEKLVQPEERDFDLLAGLAAREALLHLAAEPIEGDDVVPGRDACFLR